MISTKLTDDLAAIAACHGINMIAFYYLNPLSVAGDADWPGRQEPRGQHLLLGGAQEFKGANLIGSFLTRRVCRHRTGIDSR